MSTETKHIYLRVTITEDYEDTHPALILEDFVANPKAWEYELLDDPAQQAQALAGAALKTIAPFVEEDFYPNCSTPAFTAAVMKMREALAGIERGK